MGPLRVLRSSLGVAENVARTGLLLRGKQDSLLPVFAVRVDEQTLSERT